MVNNINEMSERDVLDNLSELKHRVRVIEDYIESPYDSKDELIEARVLLKGMELAKVLGVIL